ncbi:MAG: TolC family protein, partial [Bacteroidota bacterium]
RRIALNIQRINSGEKASGIGVKMISKEELVINMATARQIKYSPAWETLSEAVLINEERDDISRSVSIFSAIEEGLANNLDIAIARNEVDVVAADVKIAKAGLLPDLSVSGSHSIVDETTAETSFGQSPEHRGLASAELEQVIYSEQVSANKRIQQYLFSAQEAAQEVQSLDVVLDVSTSYLNLMQAKTEERIQRDNLDVTRKNLELARVSSSLGQSGPSDLYRWQGEIATAKSDLLNATAQRKQAELALNQILNRPVDEEFNTVEVDLEDARLAINNENINSYVSNPVAFHRFGDFMVDRANRITPDLRQIDYNIKAQERTLKQNQRVQYIPNLSVSGGYNYELYRSGAGTDFSAVTGELNDWNWNVSVGASIPIFQGFSRDAQVQQARVQVLQLNNERLNTSRLINQDVRSNLESIRASYTNIQLTKDAETAVVKNFELVQDAYSKGTVTITQLLDAQNAAISAQLNSANAIYVFLIDLLQMERAAGSFYMLYTEEQKAAFILELTDFFNNP